MILKFPITEIHWGIWSRIWNNFVKVDGRAVFPTQHQAQAAIDQAKAKDGTDAEGFFKRDCYPKPKRKYIGSRLTFIEVEPL